MSRLQIVLLVLWASALVVCALMPPMLFYGVLAAVLLGGAALLVGGSVLGAVLAGLTTLRRRQLARRNPLDPSLRALVASDLSWDCCALSPEFSGAALTAFRFLVEEEGFTPARMDRDFLLLSFRRGDVVVSVGEGTGPTGPEAVVEVALTYSPDSFRPVASVAFGSETDGLGEGLRGAAFHVRSNLDRIVGELRGSATLSAA